ncbi:ISL3 family transposase [Dictyobacter formicarum]|uniref:Transposase n=1 Tax=Dictyobacter formicarum TaxID=2778368 RepID=A0ABQ3VID4_9CHLR|nr:ISL3 family transposase [Dictyobacter formicarum]GHO85937.1 transposase [Dictyobacter formicarum]
MGSEVHSPLLPDPTCLHLTHLKTSPKMITVVVTTTASQARCPVCQSLSGHVHSRYVRTVADLPWMGWEVRLEIHTRRFFCLNLACPRQIFTERLPSVVAPYAHRTTRLADVFTLIGFAIGGEAGKRVIAGMGLVTSPDTLLRLIQAAPEISHATPRVLGVDDWSFRRGRKFGTILIDLEKHIPIELLPDREASTLATWLQEHVGVEIISRDRGGTYAEGASLGAPDAQQVADRWHILKNVGEALEGFFISKKSLLKDTMLELTASTRKSSPLQESPMGNTKRLEEVSLQRHQEKVERYRKIHELHAKKVDQGIIAHEVGTSRQTVSRYIHMDQPPERRCPRRTRIHLLEPFKPYLLERWNEGCRNASELFRELQERGYTASMSNVTRFIKKLRTTKGKPRGFKRVEPTPETIATKKDTQVRRPPTALQVSRWMTFTEEQRLDWQNAYLTRLCEADPLIAQTFTLLQDFAAMLRERQGARLDAWLAQVEEQEVTELKNFARGLQKDYDAVKAGLTLEWSNGQVEGHVQRLKLLKRQSYGRASFQILRKRVLKHA